MADTNKQKKPMVIPDELREFFEDLLDEAGFVLRDSVREQIMQELFVELDIYLRTEIVEQLPEDKLEEFAQLAKDHPDDPMKVAEYLQKHIPNAEEVFANSLEAFRELYLRDAAGDEAAEKQSNLEDIEQAKAQEKN